MSPDCTRGDVRKPTRTKQSSCWVLRAQQPCRAGWLPVGLKRILTCLCVELESGICPLKWNQGIGPSCLATAHQMHHINTRTDTGGLRTQAIVWRRQMLAVKITQAALKFPLHLALEVLASSVPSTQMFLLHHFACVTFRFLLGFAIAHINTVIQRPPVY